MPRLRSLPHATLAAVAAFAVAVPVVGAATSSRDQITARTISVDKAKPVGYDGTHTAHLNARLSFPSAWRVLGSGSHLTLRTSRPGCTYTVRARTQMSVTGDSPADHLLALTPASGRYVIDAGTRGRNAWRVTRVRDDDQVRLVAAAVVPVSSSIARGLGLGSGQHAYQDVVVRAESRPRDECHSGTYREGLGPQIGDALALLRTRHYVSL